MAAISFQKLTVWRGGTGLLHLLFFALIIPAVSGLSTISLPDISGMWRCDHSEEAGNIRLIADGRDGVLRAVFRGHDYMIWHNATDGSLTAVESDGGVAGVLALDGSQPVSNILPSLQITWDASVLCGRTWMRAPLVEPYPPLGGGSFSGSAVPFSPDPLVAYVWDHANASQLQVYMDGAVDATADPPSAFTGLPSLVNATSGASVTVRGVGTIVLMFATECGGWLEMQAAMPPGAVVEMSISEYNEPGIYNAGPPHPNKTAVPVTYADGWVRLELNPELYEGVRFGFVHVRNVPAPWTITAIRRVCQIKPTNYGGALASSDAILNRIWWTAAYTVKVNLLADYFGSILIDRGDRISWTGDAHTSQACALASLGDYAFINSNLMRTMCPTCSNGIESYAMYWILSAYDYVLYSGDLSSMDVLLASAAAKLAHAFTVYNVSANLAFYGPDDRVGADFEYPSYPESQRAFCMLVIRACRAVATMAAWVGKTDVAANYSQIAAKYAATARLAPAWQAAYGLHAAADAINAGVPTPAEAEAMFQREFVSPVELCSFGPFNMYFVITAMARAGHVGEALDAVRRCWGGMLQLGATTFWETFSPEWQRFLQPTDAIPNGATGFTSMAHPWGAGVTLWLTNYLLGITPTSPGFASFHVQPGLGLPQSPASVSGTVPSPSGPITFAFDTATMQGHLSFKGGNATLCFIGSLASCAITLDGVHAGMGCSAPFSHSVDIALACPEPGVTIPLDAPPVPPLPNLTAYPARFVNLDNTTSGNWVGKYGADGYYLFSCHAPNSDTVKLPSYVSSVAVLPFAAGRTGTWAANTSDTRALAVPGGRCLGFRATKVPEACQETIVVEITLPVPHAYQVALYVCDWLRLGLRQVIEMRDPVRYQIIAPTHMAEGAEECVYLTYAYNTSARFRINQVRNGDAVLSAMFFDPA